MNTRQAKQYIFFALFLLAVILLISAVAAEINPIYMVFVPLVGTQQLGIKPDITKDIHIAGYGQSLSQGVTAINPQVQNMQNYGDVWTHNRYGVGATDIAGLAKGSGPYTAMLAAINGRSEKYFVVDFIHGEADRYTDPAVYAAHLKKLYFDLQVDVPEFTPFVIDQFSSLYSGDTELYPVVIALHDVSLSNGNITMVGPKYQYRDYYDADKIHLTVEGYEWLADQHAKVIYKVFYEKGFTPLQPKTISYDGGLKILVTFDVPVGPLQIDTTTVPMHPNGCYGFEVSDSAADCASVKVNSDSVEITLTQAIADNDARLRYAWSQVDAFGPFGNIKDSDPTRLIISGKSAANWLVHFDREI